MYSYKELENYTVAQLKVLLEYEGKEYSYKDKKANLIDNLLQLPLFSLESEPEPPCSVRVQRIRDSR